MSEDQSSMASGVTMLRAGGAAIELVRIPPGDFTMGSPESEKGHAANEGPARRVRISRAFRIGRFEITRAQYRAVMGGPAGDAGDDALPISQIRYSDAIEFCRRLSRAANVEVGLPTEAEWEYACRAGTKTPYFSGSGESDLDRVGWHSGNAQGGPHLVGKKQPNAWGLYDTHGNAWELCADFIEDYATMPAIDPVGRVSLTQGAMRGGGWMHDAEACRAATRMISDDMFGGAGFRIAVRGD